MPAKSAVLMTHLGLGDMIYSYGIGSYLSRVYESVVVVVREDHHAVVLALYSAHANVSLYSISNKTHMSVNKTTLKRIFPESDVFAAGCHGGHSIPLDIFPLSFFDDVGVARKQFWTPATFLRTPESRALYEELLDISYTFVHNHTSSGFVFDDAAALSALHVDTDATLVINTHKNIYPRGHKYYDIAQKFLTPRPMLDYCYILENASMLILSDSSMHALCHLLHIRSTANFLFKRSKNPNIFKLLYENSTYGADEDVVRVKFTIMND